MDQYDARLVNQPGSIYRSNLYKPPKRSTIPRKRKPIQGYIGSRSDFYSYLQQHGTCLVWTGYLNDKWASYIVGEFKIHGHRTDTTLVHRLIIELELGNIPLGIDIEPSCGNRLCCNLDHLLGGQKCTTNKRPIRSYFAQPVSEITTLAA